MSATSVNADAAAYFPSITWEVGWLVSWFNVWRFQHKWANRAMSAQEINPITDLLYTDGRTRIRTPVLQLYKLADSVTWDEPPTPTF